MRTISFTIPGQPVGKGRPRIGRVGAHARMFTPEKTASYEGLVAHEGRLAMGGTELLTGPVRITIFIDMQIPASWSAKKRALAMEGKTHPTTKPDCSNVLKAIEDGLNGVVYRDDVQIVEGWFRKRYAEKPQVQVLVSEVE